MLYKNCNHIPYNAEVRTVKILPFRVRTNPIQKEVYVSMQARILFNGKIGIQSMPSRFDFEIQSCFSIFHMQLETNSKFSQ